MDSSNASCASSAGRRSPVDEDSRSSDHRTPSRLSPADHRRKQQAFPTSDPIVRKDRDCHADQSGEKSESDSSDVDIEDEEEEEVRVKIESVNPAKKTTAKPLRSFLIDDILNHKPKRSQTSITDSTITPATTATTTPSSARCLNSGSSIVRPWDLPAQNRHKRSPYTQRASPPLHSRSLSGYERAHSLYLRTRTSSSPKVSGIRPRSADDDSQSEASSDMSEEGTTAGRSGGNNSSSGKGDGNSPLDALFELTNKALDRVNGDKSAGEWMLVDRGVSRRHVITAALN